MTFEPDCSRIHIHDMKNNRADVLIRRKELRDYPLHWHDCFEIELVLCGKAQHTLNGEPYTLSAGSLYLLRPTDFHAVQLVEPVTVYNLMFLEDAIDDELLNLIMDADANLAAQLDAVEYAELSALMQLAVREFDGNQRYRDACLHHLLECIFIRSVRLCAQPPRRRTGTPPTLQKTLTYLHGHFRENPSMAEMAAQSGFNPCYFSALFHKETGKTYKAYLTDLKLNYARKLALASTLQVTEICYASGFNSLSHFMREYKARFGVSPRTSRVKHTAESPTAPQESPG